MSEPAEPEDPRVRLAGERTLLAWIRTGLAMMGFGFVVARFGLFLRVLDNGRSAGPGPSLWMGVALVVLGVGTTLLAALQHGRFLQDLQQKRPYQPPRSSLGLIVAGLLAAIGIGMAAYLLLTQ